MQKGNVQLASCWTILGSSGMSLAYEHIMNFFNISSRITLNTSENTVSAPAKTSKNQHPFILKWEKRKKVGYAPSIRSGCNMALWSSKGMGVLFGGVTDEDTNEETLESVFHNDMLVDAIALAPQQSSLIITLQVRVSSRWQWTMDIAFFTKAEEEREARKFEKEAKCCSNSDAGVDTRRGRRRQCFWRG